MINDAGKHRVKGEEIVAERERYVAPWQCAGGPKGQKLAKTTEIGVRPLPRWNQGRDV